MKVLKIKALIFAFKYVLPCLTNEDLCMRNVHIFNVCMHRNVNLVLLAAVIISLRLKAFFLKDRPADVMV